MSSYTTVMLPMGYAADYQGISLLSASSAVSSASFKGLLQHDKTYRMDCICWPSVLNLDYTINGHFTVKSILQGKGSYMAGKIQK